MNGLAAFPETPNIKRLATHSPAYRLRVGRYRVLFDFDGGIKVVLIEEVWKRDERTY